MNDGNNTPINISEIWGLSKLKEPWLFEISINFAEEIVMIKKMPDKNGDADLLLIKPINEEICSVNSGYRKKNGQYYFIGEVGRIPVSFVNISMFIQPLISLSN